jgi:hypothetical protein
MKMSFLKKLAQQNLPVAFSCRDWLFSACSSSNASIASSGFSSSSDVNQHDEIAFIDPKRVLDRSAWSELRQALSEKDDTHHGLFTLLKIPRDLSLELPRAKHELGDFDEPLNSWLVGATDEIFRYRMVGEHQVKSGFTSALPLALLRSISEGKVTGLPTWLEVEIRIKSAKGLRLPSVTVPFVFLGRIIESDTASMYTLGLKTQETGIIITASPAANHWDAGERRPKFS